MSANGCQKRDVAVVGVAAMPGTVSPLRLPGTSKVPVRTVPLRRAARAAPRPTSSTARRESRVLASQRQNPWIAPS